MISCGRSPSTPKSSLWKTAATTAPLTSLKSVRASTLTFASCNLPIMCAARAWRSSMACWRRREPWRFICDADLSMRIEDLMRFLPPESDGYDIIIASREAPGSVNVDEPKYRHIMGRIANFIIKVVAISDYEDTQCGFKMFSGEVAGDLFAVQRMNGIGFRCRVIVYRQAARLSRKGSADHLVSRSLLQHSPLGRLDQPSARDLGSAAELAPRRIWLSARPGPGRRVCNTSGTISAPATV